MLETSESQLLRCISAEEIRCALTKLLSSRTFRSAQGQSKFLAYAVTQFIAGQSELIKEYWIGREALGRGDAFDPRHDPIVRTQARKLRLRLAKYYQTEGAADPICIEFPKGSYVPVFQRAQSQSEEAEAAQLAPEPRVEIAGDRDAIPEAFLSNEASPSNEASISDEACISIPSASAIGAVAEVTEAPKAISFLRNSMAFGIPIGVLGVAIAVAIYRWLSN
jgi:hypothetical protein